MRYEIIALRDVKMNGPEWITLAEARERGIPLDWVADGIGPRERGMVYRSGYWGTVNTVHDVFVKIAPEDRDPRKFYAVWWSVAEESADDHGRIRSHCTSWAYDVRNQPLAVLETSGS